MMSAGPEAPCGFDHVEAWVFDLDNTLYPADCNLFAQIDRRMGEFIAQELGLNLDEAQALRQAYYYEHGTTLAGLVRMHGVSPDAFLDYVHDIDLSAVAAAPELAAALDALPGRKFVFTNGSRKHAERVVERLGVLGRFEAIFDIHALEYVHPKPTHEAYRRFMQACRVTPAEGAMFDDLPHNLKTAHELGMTTVLVHGLTEHPEHQAIASWTGLPAHIHHRTDALAPFLGAIAASLVKRSDSVQTVPHNAQYCLT
ncbi:pyrimidine 5'-nucleotidase [Methyloceanibacter sp.]|uniref:pyrimidine 5'-nucleotidase n=1 Tax=Methyloceanibacter sp. TaxID=1965321 RepID=UPI002D35F11D|nr:pyrimidine 5'-nucleotidase [Methyloceanibacter sp.]HZP10098.1 pyrimidine 5'-nucleotidase [Methyloceanibacter sp.]